MVACLQVDYQSAHSYALETLKVSQEMGDKVGIACALTIFAALAVRSGEPEKAARLRGAGQAICEAIGYKTEPADEKFDDLYESEARAAIGDEKFEAAFAEGLKMSLKEAIALAREGEADILSATHITDEANSKNTQILTNDALEVQTAIFAPSAPTNPEISRPNDFLSNVRYKQIFATALIVILLTAGGFFGYRYFVTTGNRIKSIAVMPFLNESNNADIEYLSDGMTETLINSLSQIPSLNVKARSSVFRYKGKETDYKKIASELNVQAILLGRIVQRGGQMNLNLELIDPQTENVLWGKRYEIKFSELVALQSEVAHDVSSNLKAKLSNADFAKVEKNYTDNPEAYQLYLRGRFYWNKRNAKGFEKAIEYFNQAVEKDPNYSLAYTGLADTYALMPLYGNFRPKDFMPKAKQSALKALELDDDLAEAHASLGRILNSYDFEWENAEREYKRSIELNPNYATVHQWYAEFLAFDGRLDEALGEISKALKLDPFSVTVNRMNGNILGFAKRFDEAIGQLRKTEELYPENAVVKFNLGDAFTGKKMYSEAVEEYLSALKLDGLEQEKVQKLQDTFRTDGWKGFWQEYLNQQLEVRKKLLEKDETAYINNEDIAYAYAALKDKDKTLEYLNKAFEERDPDLITIKMSEVYDFLSGDPQFKMLIKNIGLPD